jgi:hypothetical protein
METTKTLEVGILIEKSETLEGGISINIRDP